MGGDNDRGIAAVLCRRLEIALACLLEIHRPVGKETVFRHRGPQPVGHRAQVLADDEALIALALQRQYSQQVGERIVDVGAFLRARAFRHPEEPHEPHDVVEAQHARVAHQLPQRGHVRSVGGRREALRNPRRQPPLLALQIEIVGRAADAGGQRVATGLDPRLGSPGIHADRQVLEEAERYVQLAQAPRDLAELQVSLPLEVQEVVDALAVFAGEGRHCRRARIAVRLGPRRPTPHRGIVAGEVLLQRFEQRMQAQRLAAFGLERPKRPRAVAVLREMPLAKAPVA